MDYQHQRVELRGAGLALAASRCPEILVVGPRGTSKSVSRMLHILTLAATYPKSRHLLCRQTRASMTNSTLVTLEKVMGDCAEVRRMDKQHRQSYKIGTSEIVCLGLDEPAKCYGSEWDSVTLDEGVEASESAWDAFGAVMRNFKMPWHSRCILTNPGPSQHWINKRFPTAPRLRMVESWEDYKSIEAYNAQDPVDGRQRLLSVHQDNPSYFDMMRWEWTRRGREYVNGVLARYVGHFREQFFIGNWCNAEGSVFPEFNEDVNVVPDFWPPDWWSVYLSIDPGYQHPCGVAFLTVAPNGTRYCFDELYLRQMDVAAVASKIQDKLGGRGVTRVYIDPRHGFSRTAQSVKTIAEQFKENGIECVGYPAAAGSVTEASVSDHRRAIIDATFKVCRRCVNCIAEHQSWSYKRTASGDVPVGDDAYVDSNNDLLDPIMGWERTNPSFDPVGIRFSTDTTHVNEGVGLVEYGF